MKVKDLIEDLKKCDPESLVVAGGGTVRFVEEMQYYWDGTYPEKLEIPLKYFTGKWKCVLHTWDEEDWLETFCLRHNNEGFCVLPWKKIKEMIDLSNLYGYWNKDPKESIVFDIWLDWLIACKFRIWKGLD